MLAEDVPCGGGYQAFVLLYPFVSALAVELIGQRAAQLALDVLIDDGGIQLIGVKVSPGQVADRVLASLLRKQGETTTIRIRSIRAKNLRTPYEV